MHPWSAWTWRHSTHNSQFSSHTPERVDANENGAKAGICNLGVDLGRSDAGVAQELLDKADVDTFFQ